jgi:cytochrome c biogenesis protein
LDTTTDKQSIVEKIWSFFSSVKLAVGIFAIISLTSIIGTIVEQQAEPANNIALLAKLFGEAAAPVVYSALDATGFTDMFNSWWFLALLFVFATNLVVCSLERLPRAWKIVKEPITPLQEAQLALMTPKHEVVLHGDIAKAEQQVREALKAIGFKGALVTEQGTTQLCAEKGRYSRLGVYVTHLSILLILIGGVVGMRFGFNGHLNLLEGTASPLAYKSNAQEVPLGFEIRCDDFEVSFYPDSERPKEYKSVLTILELGREVLTQEIGVNSPLRYKGITFYQASFGFSPQKDALFKLAVTPTGGARAAVAAKFTQPFKIPGTKLSAKVVDFSPALAANDSGKLFTFAESMVNPAVLVEFFEGNKPKHKQWILKRYPETWSTPVGEVEFQDLWGVQYTGLQVRRDPGVWIVYLGCMVMALGLYAAFFMSHRKIWVSLKEEKGRTTLLIVASMNKNRAGLDATLEKLVKHLAEKA